MPTPAALSLTNLELAADILADAFSDDPVMDWVFGDMRAGRTLYTNYGRAKYLPEGFGHVADDDGAAMWLPPGVAKDVPLHRSLPLARDMLRYGGLRSVMRGLRFDTGVARFKPNAPHFYLFAIGTRAASRGRGAGKRLMEAGLARADAAGMPCYLESSKATNVPYYRRFGFEVTERFHVAEGAPPMWGMWREGR